VAPSSRRVRQPEPLEQVRQKFGRDSLSGIGDAYFQCELTRSNRTWTCPAFGVNLIAFVSRFQTTCWSRFTSPATGPACGSSTVRRRTPFTSAEGTARMRTLPVRMLDLATALEDHDRESTTYYFDSRSGEIVFLTEDGRGSDKRWDIISEQ